jgi:hypothetical protein
MYFPHVGKHYQFIPLIQNDGPFAFISNLMKDFCKLFMKMKDVKQTLNAMMF